jgi:hypothetical protein
VAEPDGRDKGIFPYRICFVKASYSVPIYPSLAEGETKRFRPLRREAGIR